MSVRDDLKKIYSAAIDAVDPQKAIQNHLQRNGEILTLQSDNTTIASYDLNSFDNIYIVGAGKATSPMALAVEEILGDRISSGCICVKYDYTTDLKKIEIIEASHPIPDANGMIGAEKILQILNKAGEKDLVISLISGGGSALLPLPPESISLNEKRETTDLLLKCGASIHEINSIRKHLSLVKGGNLAKAAYPATVINCMISDVVGDNMDVIASGPFVADNSTFEYANSVIKKYDLISRIPETVSEYLQDGNNGKLEENPNESDSIFSKIRNQIIASNIIALKAAKNVAESLNYNTVILSSLIEGDTADVSLWHSRIAKEILASSNPIPKPACIISGGETTVTVTGNGLGGRNMEFAIQGAVQIDGYNEIAIASVGTDGTDGPTDAAGAIADGFTIKRAVEKELDIEAYIENNDSYHFFKEIGDLVITGPTNTNVMDIRIVLIQ